MNIIDCFFILIFLFSLLIGLKRGIIKELNLLIAWSMTFFLVKKYIFSFFISSNFYYQNKILGLSILFFLFFFILFVIKIILNYFFLLFLENFNLKIADKILGMCFGVLRGGIVILFFLLYVKKYADFFLKSHIKESFLIFYLENFYQYIIFFIKENNLFKYFFK